jgi:amidase
MFAENSGEDYLALMENIIKIMKEHGAECVEIPAHELKSGDKFGAIMNNEFKCGINNYLASMRNSRVPKNLREIILYNQNHEKEALKYGQSKLIYCQNNSSGTLTEP